VARNETFSVQPGGQVLSYQPHGFSDIFSVWVNNFSGGWLGIEGQNLWVPPYTRGWKATIFPSTSSITVRSYDFANGMVITGATGQAAQVTIWDDAEGDSEGIKFFDEQTVPIFTFTGAPPLVAGEATGILVAGPPVGRIRIYEAHLEYAHVGPPNPPSAIQCDQALQALLSSDVGPDPNNIMGLLEISPASPSDTKIFTAPGGDLPIGATLYFTIEADTSRDPQALYEIIVRYAVT
jgi:hypothetical protein